MEILQISLPKNLRQEIEILRMLNHENIIMLLDRFETETDFVMVMEYGEVYKKMFVLCCF
jgi:fused-like protein